MRDIFQRNKRGLFRLLTAHCLLLTLLAVPAYATAPTADSFSSTASTVGATLLQLQGADADGTALVYAIGTSPTRGTLSGLITATGYVVYTPTASYTGADSFTYTVTSGGATTSPATVTLTVTNAKTRIVDTLVDSAGSPRAGVVTFILTQKVYSPAGLIPVSSTVSATLSGGSFDVSLYPSTALSPQAYYQMWFTATGSLRRELIGVYAIPATSATSILLEPYRVTDTNLAAQYTFMSTAAINSLTTGLGGAVTAFNGRIGAVTPTTNDYTWAQIDKATSSIADITTRSAADLSSGQLPLARLGSLTDTALPYKTSSALADSPLLRLGSGTVGFDTGTAAAPSTGSSLTGTRLLMYPGSTGEHIGMGVESGKLWFNVGSVNAYKYYWAASTAEHHTVTPGQYLVTTAGSTFTFDYHTSATPSTAAMIIKTNADTVRISTNDTAVWDFQSNVSFRPVDDAAVDIGDSTHRIINLFTKNVKYYGSTSGVTTVSATATAGTTTLTLPSATDTLVGRATTDTLTNKSLTSPTLTGTPVAPTAAAGTSTTQIATTAFVQGEGQGLKRYRALLTQTSTGSPTATVLENSLGGTVVWARTGTGTYTGTLSSTFTASKTMVFMGPDWAGNITAFSMLKATRTSTSVITIETASINTPADGQMTDTSIEILVYP
ncbi:MAG: Ig-like domain-containing protein [Pyrinomonadaceae bacterium]